MDQGHDVLVYNPVPGKICDLPEELERRGFRPDILVQKEPLAPRAPIRGLEELDCVKVFWAIDPHLNAFWQSEYGKLFDVFCATQTGWNDALKARGMERVEWLPWHGMTLDWLPWSARRHAMTFAGRVTPERAVRAAFLRSLEQGFPGVLNHVDGVGFDEMLEIYRQSKIAPNESILGEINFRLFEGASCGCVVLGQDLGPDQAALFEPGKEMETYSDVLELREKAARLLRHEGLMQSMARAAWERIRRDHLPEHRVNDIIKLAETTPKRALSGAESQKCFTLALFLQAEAGRIEVDARQLDRDLAALEHTPEARAFRIRLAALAGRTDHACRLAIELLHRPPAPGEFLAELAGSMAGIRAGDMELARALRIRTLKRSPRQEQATVPNASPARLYRDWARDLLRRGQGLRSGFPYQAGKHLPASASECLQAALDIDPQDLEATRALESLYEPVVGLEHARLGLLSTLTLHRRDDWRLLVKAAQANLRCFRAGQGLEELLLAHEAARQKGQDSAFRRTLNGRDPSGRLLRLLEAGTSAPQNGQDHGGAP